MGSKRLLLVDENPDFLKGLQDWFEEQQGFEVAGSARSGNEALERIASLAPDIVLADMALKDVSVFELVRRVKSEPGAPTIILMTFHDSRAARSLCEAVHSDGLVVKSRVTEQFPALLSGLDALRDSAPAETPHSTTEDSPPGRGPVPRRKP